MGMGEQLQGSGQAVYSDLRGNLAALWPMKQVGKNWLIDTWSDSVDRSFEIESVSFPMNPCVFLKSPVPGSCQRHILLSLGRWTGDGKARSSHSTGTIREGLFNRFPACHS